MFTQFTEKSNLANVILDHGVASMSLIYPHLALFTKHRKFSFKLDERAVSHLRGHVMKSLLAVNTSFEWCRPTGGIDCCSPLLGILHVLPVHQKSNGIFGLWVATHRRRNSRRCRCCDFRRNISAFHHPAVNLIKSVRDRSRSGQARKAALAKRKEGSKRLRKLKKERIRAHVDVM